MLVYLSRPIWFYMPIMLITLITKNDCDGSLAVNVTPALDVTTGTFSVFSRYMRIMTDMTTIPTF